MTGFGRWLRSKIWPVNDDNDRAAYLDICKRFGPPSCDVAHPSISEITSAKERLTKLEDFTKTISDPVIARCYQGWANHLRCSIEEAEHLST